SQTQTTTTTLKERIKGIENGTYNGVKVEPSNGSFIKEPQQVLTAWIPNGAYTYTFNNTAFQKCKGWSEGNEDKPPVIGDCYSGGRVGYSVKIISRDALNSDKIKIGIHTGKLKNPPPPPDTF
ncbi:MAG: hypothetical protein HAW60_03120, partial [Bdellovibrionales bacterium]|nr:hypothetical protein [Bdellovibrionales bacterium]